MELSSTENHENLRHDIKTTRLGFGIRVSTFQVQVRKVYEPNCLVYACTRTYLHNT